MTSDLSSVFIKIFNHCNGEFMFVFEKQKTEI